MLNVMVTSRSISLSSAGWIISIIINTRNPSVSTRPIRRSAAHIRGGTAWSMMSTTTFSSRRKTPGKATKMQKTSANSMTSMTPRIGASNISRMITAAAVNSIIKAKTRAAA